MPDTIVLPWRPTTQVLVPLGSRITLDCSVSCVYEVVVMNHAELDFSTKETRIVVAKGSDPHHDWPIVRRKEKGGGDEADSLDQAAL